MKLLVIVYTEKGINKFTTTDIDVATLQIVHNDTIKIEIIRLIEQ